MCSSDLFSLADTARLLKTRGQAMQSAVPVGEGGERACRVELHLSYGFSNFALQALVGPVFDTIASSLVEAFVKRAEPDAAAAMAIDAAIHHEREAVIADLRREEHGHAEPRAFVDAAHPAVSDKKGRSGKEVELAHIRMRLDVFRQRCCGGDADIRHARRQGKRDICAFALLDV